MPVSVPVQGGAFPQTSQQQGSGGSVVLLQPPTAHTSMQQPTGKIMKNCDKTLKFQLEFLFFYEVKLYV